MKKAIFYGTIIAGIVVMMALSIMPAMATHTHGIIVSINPSEKHGMIERTDDGSLDLYQFRIPQDVASGYDPEVGDEVGFLIDPENSRHATVVGKGCPPHCSNHDGGTGL